MARYLRLFTNNTAYNAAQNLNLPNVSLSEEEYQIHFTDLNNNLGNICIKLDNGNISNKQDFNLNTSTYTFNANPLDVQQCIIEFTDYVPYDVNAANCTSQINGKTITLTGTTPWTSGLSITVYYGASYSYSFNVTFTS